MDTYPEQTQIGSKPADLHMSGPSARERGPSGYVVTVPPFHLHDEDHEDPIDAFLGQGVGVAPAQGHDVLDGQAGLHAGRQRPATTRSVSSEGSAASGTSTPAGGALSR